MGNTFEIFEGIAIIITALISAVALFASKSQHRTSIMTTKRSERIEKMRENSSGIISCVKCILCDLGDKQNTMDLLHHAHSFISLLQYQDEYKKDVDLIKRIHAIVNLCIAKNIDKQELELEIQDFWWKCNVYIGADFERLKNESTGHIHKGGKILREAISFDQIYDMLDKDYEKLNFGKRLSEDKASTK